jgi:hypothetical protein
MSDSAIVNGVERKHYHHAEAKALHGTFELPLKHVIEPQAFAALEENGGYLSQHALPFRSEGVVSYRAAHTQVAGNRDAKKEHGWSTISTSVVEGLNILEVVTADRVVAQIFAEYPLDGYVPAISFLGTRFENLRIAGEPVNLKLDLDLFGEPMDGYKHYIAHGGFMGRVKAQREALFSFPTLPAHTRKTYDHYNRSEVVNGISETVECSLVNQIEGSFPGKAYGHAMFIPHFGTIHFATVKVTHDDFVNGVPHKTMVELMMVDAKLGCIGHGDVGAASTKTNGHTRP